MNSDPLKSLVLEAKYSDIRSNKMEGYSKITWTIREDFENDLQLLNDFGKEINLDFR